MGFQTLDGFVRERIRAWPQTPPGLEAADARGHGVWLKARPGPASENDAPSLKIPGAARMRTFPDGLWLWFGGTAADPFVDIFAIEVCGSLQNLLDKRSRYTPSLHSLLISCPAVWLKRAVAEQDDIPRWRTIGLFEREPETTVALPVRDMRVLYALKPRQFDEFAAHNIAHAHELFAPIDVLIDEAGWQAPALRQFLFHAARRANFWDKAAYTCNEPWRGNPAPGVLDGKPSPVRPIGDYPINTKPDHTIKRLGRIDRPRQNKEAERLGLADIGLLEGRMKRRPARSPRRGDGLDYLTVECA